MVRLIVTALVLTEWLAACTLDTQASRIEKTSTVAKPIARFIPIGEKDAGLDAVSTAMAGQHVVSTAGADPSAAAGGDAAAGKPASKTSAPRPAAVAAGTLRAGSSGGGSGGMAGDLVEPAADGGTFVCRTDATRCCRMTESNDCVCTSVDVDSDSDGKPDCTDPAPYGYQKRVTFDGSQIAATLVDFPVLIRITDAELEAGTRANGEDIRFVASDGISALDYEIESFTADLGALVAWVRIPSLAAGVDTVIYIAYGESPAIRGNPRAVWSDFQHVWHLAEDPALGSANAIKDSTERANATAQGAMMMENLVSAVAGQGLTFDGVDDELTFQNSFTGAGPSTLSAWVNQSEENAAYGGAVIAFGNEVVNQARFLLSVDSASGAVGVGFYSNDVTGSVLSVQQWSHLVWVWDGTNSSIYVDGVVTSGPTAHAGASTSGTAGKIGNSTFSYPRFLRGQLDEVRVAPSARASGWVSTEYNNQRPNSTFIRSIDEQQPRSAQ